MAGAKRSGKLTFVTCTACGERVEMAGAITRRTVRHDGTARCRCGHRYRITYRVEGIGTDRDRGSGT